MKTPTQDQISEARSHLHAILVQAIPSDDKIIIDHVMQAYLALGGGLNDFLSHRPFCEPKCDCIAMALSGSGGLVMPPCSDENCQYYRGRRTGK